MNMYTCFFLFLLKSAKINTNEKNNQDGAGTCWISFFSIVFDFLMKYELTTFFFFLINILFYLFLSYFLFSSFKKILKGDGNLYTFGLNNHGALGGDRVNEYEPDQVDFFRSHRLKVVDVSCGERHTVAVTGLIKKKLRLKF